MYASSRSFRLGHIFLFFFLLSSQGACSSIYYSFWETFGVEKRDLLKRDISRAQKAQQRSQDALGSTLDRIQALYGLEGGKLETAYRGLSRDFENAELAARSLSDRISSIDSIARDLFREWRREADLIQNADMKAQSLNRLKETESRFQDMLTAMQGTEASMEPVLLTMRDHVLFLKHNLNALALTSFHEEFSSIKTDIQGLIQTMNRSIEESNRFLQTLNT